MMRPDVGKPSCHQPSVGDSRSPPPHLSSTGRAERRRWRKSKDIRDRMILVEETINHVRVSAMFQVTSLLSSYNAFFH